MGQAYSIWTPVVIGRLKSPQRIKEEKVYAIEKAYKSIEDLKVKVRHCRVQPQGQAIEAWLKLDILSLVEDLLGGMHLITREETVRERIVLTDFDNYIDKSGDIKYIVNILNVTSYGELKGQTLKIAYFIDLMIIATCEQVVNLSSADEVEPAHDSLQDVLTKLRLEVQQVEEEKEELRRKIFFYERDISSLKKGLQKAENKNAALNKEVEQYNQIVEQLRVAIRDKELRLNRYENVYYNRDYEEGKDEDMTHTLGSRIKRMFASN